MLLFQFPCLCLCHITSSTSLSLSLPSFPSHLSFVSSHPFFFNLPMFPLLTTPTERPQPPRKLSVPQDGVESRRLRLHWVTGGSGSSPLRYFTLQVKELPSGEWSTHTADIPHNVTTWTVDRYNHMCICPVTHAKPLPQTVIV